MENKYNLEIKTLLELVQSNQHTAETHKTLEMGLYYMIMSFMYYEQIQKFINKEISEKDFNKNINKITKKYKNI